MKLLRIARFSLLVLVGSGVLAAGLLIGAYLYVAGSLPKVETLADYRPPVITRVLSDDGSVIAEFYRERRIVVPVERMPRELVQAFVAAEDASFFEHQGIDLVSIFRAAVKNLKAGGIVQGGSTITQQVAKSLLLTPERKFSRKFKEAILAWRMEKSLDKDDILHLYLNQIYLGHGAYGVQAAAENYFAKDVADLNLAECAILAGLPQAPSRYSPYSHFDRAKQRQKYVLEQMVAGGFITPLRTRMAGTRSLTIHPRPQLQDNDTAFFTEQVRRYLEQTYGEERLYTAGLEVHTTMNLAQQRAAQRAVQENLRAYDRRQGYRGPRKVLAEEAVADFLAGQQAELEASPPEAGSTLQGVLLGLEGKALQVAVGERRGRIELAETGWAAPIRVVPPGAAATGNADSEETRLPRGSLLEVRVLRMPADGPLELALTQEPLAEGALVAVDPHSGQVKAMVGGYDFGRSQFNRAIQARRLPGSAIKPIIYAAALDKGFTPASVIYDTPVIFEETDQEGRKVAWKPENYGEKFTGSMSFREALTHSANVVTIKILREIGINYAANYARKLGIESPIARDLTFALGSSALTPLELATAYSVFASGGVRHPPRYITRVLDRDGRILESTDPADFPDGPDSDQRLVRKGARRVISPETAYLVTNLMESVVRNGTGWRAKRLGRPVAGKTGTTNDLKDAWFAGFVPQLVAVSWVGYDQARNLGKHETGSRAAAPAWVDFMEEAVASLPAKHFAVPDGIVFRPVDEQTGLLVPEDNPDGVIEAFAPGTAPTRYALEDSRPRARDFFRMDMEGR